MGRSALEQAGMVSRTRHISDRIAGIIVSPIKEIALLAAEIPDCIPFAWGVPFVETPPHIRDALKVALDTDPLLGRYSPSLGLPQLRSAIAEDMKKKYGIVVDPKKELLVTVGAMEGLMAAVQATVNPGDEVIITSPGFSSYTEIVTMAGGVPRYLPLDEKNGWRLKIEELPGLITTKTKALILNSPCNPTGNVFSKEDLTAIADLVVEHDILLITDEPYAFLTFDGQPLPELISDERLRHNRISCFSFSKEYAMTGYRVGYVFAEEGMIRQMLKFHDSCLVSVARPSQVAALAALQGDQACVGELREILRARRDRMCGHLDRLSKWFSYVKPNGAYYVLVRFLPGTEDVVQFAVKILHEAHVALVPGSAFGPQSTQHLRFCFGCTEKEIDEGMLRLEKWLTANYPH